MVNQRIFNRLDVSYANQHTFSKVTITRFRNYLYNYEKGSVTEIKKTEFHVKTVCPEKLQFITGATS